MIKIPAQNKWYQSNRGDLFGSIWSSFNIDLTGNRDSGNGKLRTTRMLLGASSADVTNLTVPVAFRRYGGVTYALVGNDSAGRLFKQSSAFTSAWAAVASTPTNFSNRYSDMEIFNGYLYISEGLDDDIARYDGTTWTEIAVGEITASKPHMLCVYANRLYVSGEMSSNSIIKSMDTAQTVTAVGGTNTVTINDAAKNRITFLRPVSNGIWIGTVNTRGGKGSIYFWDGAQSSGVNESYKLQSAGALAGVVKDDVLYVVDADGRLLAFNGGTFTELDRLPIKENYLTYALGDYNERWIHPNGMTVIDDRIMILIENQYYTAALKSTIEENVPSGIWEWSKDTGLYHKYSLSHCPVSSGGGGSITDYGQNRIAIPGAVNFIKTEATPSNDNGTLFAGAKIYADSSSTIFGIFIDDTNDTVQKYGYIVTPKIFSSNIVETWHRLYIRHKKLLSASDKIVVKYRTSDVAPTEATITWVDTDTFTTTTNVSAYIAGDEVEILQGTGSGKCAHISSISVNAGTYTVNLDDTFTGVTTGTAKARFQKWVKIGEQVNQDEHFYPSIIHASDVWIQFKICMQFTGKNEVYDAILTGQAHQMAE